MPKREEKRKKIIFHHSHPESLGISGQIPKIERVFYRCSRTAISGYFLLEDQYDVSDCNTCCKIKHRINSIAFRMCEFLLIFSARFRRVPHSAVFQEHF